MDSHTLGKHIVLRAYLHAWLPIMGMTNQRIVFIDGFAGPGEYENGEDGSPIVALKALDEHAAKDKITAEVIYVFIEFDKGRAENLAAKVKPFAERLPQNVRVHIRHGDCVAILNGILDSLEQQKKKLAPAFVMLDPFGVSHTPMSVVSRLLKNPRSELYLSFMYEAINRFRREPEFERPLDQLFGTGDWRKAEEIRAARERKEFLYNLYDQQLRAAGAKYVRYFELFDDVKNRHVYTIFFATKHPVGMNRMKEAIWKADQTGGYQFRGRRDGQLSLNLDLVNVAPLQRQLQEVFGDKGWVAIDTILGWAQTDKTDYYAGQVKRALQPMENDGRVEIDESSRKRKGKYPAGTRLRFNLAS